MGNVGSGESIELKSERRARRYLFQNGEQGFRISKDILNSRSG